LKRNSSRKPTIEIFDKVVQYLENLGVPRENIIGFSDLSFQYYVDNLKQYKRHIRDEVIIEMPAGIKADKAILAHCLKHENAVFISQDLMREYYIYLPYRSWIVKRRICVVLVGSEIHLIPMLDEKISQKSFKKRGEKNQRIKLKEDNLGNVKKISLSTLDILKIIEDSNKESEFELYD